MPDYIVTIRQKRTVWEHQTVVVTSSAAQYAERDARGHAAISGWETTKTETEKLQAVITAVEAV